MIDATASPTSEPLDLAGTCDESRDERAASPCFSKVDAGWVPLGVMFRLEAGELTASDLLRTECEQRGQDAPTESEIREFEESTKAKLGSLAASVQSAFANNPSLTKLRDEMSTAISAQAGSAWMAISKSIDPRIWQMIDNRELDLLEIPIDQTPILMRSLLEATVTQGDEAAKKAEASFRLAQRTHNVAKWTLWVGLSAAFMGVVSLIVALLALFH